MSEKEINCAVCGGNKDVICTLPTTKATLQRWAEILCTPSLIQSPRQKKICLAHFDTKFHEILKNPVSKRGAYIFPQSWSGNPNTSTADDDSVTFPVNDPTKRPLPSDETLHNKTKKSVNYDLLLSQKNAEISDLTKKIHDMKIEVARLTKETNKKQSLDHILSQLGVHSKSMVKLLLSKTSRSYDKDEKALCQSMYYKNSGSYKQIRALLDNKLPSVRTLNRWHELSDLGVGIVKQVVAFLIQKDQVLKSEDKDLIMIFDEMDGKRALTYDSKRDLFVGFEDLFGRRPKLVKKFLTVMIRGLNNTIGNLILANYATANGITGIFVTENLFDYR